MDWMDTSPITIHPRTRLGSCLIIQMRWSLSLLNSRYHHHANLSPSNFDKVMKWARSATTSGYKFDAPSYSTLKIQMNYTFPNTINVGPLKSKVIFLPHEVGSDLPVTMWYFEHSFGVVCKVPLRSSSHEGLCLFSPEEIYWLWITCVQQDYISWLVLWSIQQFTSGYKWNAPA